MEGRQQIDSKAIPGPYQELVFEQAVQLIPQAALIVDSKSKIHFANPAALAFFNSDGSILNAALIDLMPRTALEGWQEQLTKASDRLNHHFTAKLRISGVEVITAKITLNSLAIASNPRYFAVIEDQSEIEELNERLELLSFANNCASNGIILSDYEGNVYCANPAAGRILGYEADEFHNLKITDIDTRSDLTDLKLFFSKVGNDKELSYFGTLYKRKDGTTIFVEGTAQECRFKAKYYICHCFTEIEASGKYVNSNPQLNFLVNSGMDAIYVFDENRNILYVNDIACEMLDYTREELIGENLRLIAPQLKGDKALILSRQYTSGYKNRFESIHQKKDGTLIPVEISNAVSSIKDNVYVIAYARDIRKRKAEIKEMEQLRFALENSSDAIYLYDKDCNIFYANLSACQSLGYSRKELLNLNLDQIDNSFNPEYRIRSWNLARHKKMPAIQTEHKRKDGTCFPVEISTTTTIMNDGHKFGASFARDVTERIKADRQLHFTQVGIDSAAETILYNDMHGNITYANKTACEKLGYSMQELLQTNYIDIGKNLSKENWPQIWNLVADGNVHLFEDYHVRKDGSEYPVEITGRVHEFEGELYGCTVSRDITERLLTQRVLKESEERFRVIADTSPVALIISRAENGVITYANKQTENLFEKEIGELTQCSIVGLFDGADAKKEILNVLSEGREVNGLEIMLIRAGERPLWVSMSTKCIELQGVKVICSALLDITESKELSNKLSFHATYDPLTGLVNRREFEARLNQLIDDATRSGEKHALCFLDLDQFKIINDTCGHIAGDELLRQLAGILKNTLRKDDTVARIGGDEFGILLKNCKLGPAEKIANQIKDAVLDFRFVWQDSSFKVGVSIGLVSIGNPGETLTDVLRRADAACYAAKDSGRNRLHIYEADDEELAERHGEMQWVARITSALDENRFRLWQQSIIPLTTKGNAGLHYELLIRMLDESGNVIPPGAFLPAVERYDLGSQIDRWVISSAFSWFTSNPEQLKDLSTCAINLSGQSLSDHQLLNEIIELFEKTQLPPCKFCFEITETAAIANLVYATQFMESLKNLGCRFALDDFGSGLSSFGYLKTLPVDYVKIDGLFVKDILNDPVDLAMVKSINDMGHAMGKLTIAEFVENDGILQELKKLKVDFAQGYGISKPQPL